MVLLLVFNKTKAYTHAIMKRSSERYYVSQHCSEADEVFDSLGFSGENCCYDAVEGLQALDRFLDDSGDSKPWLVRLYRDAKDREAYDDGQIASLLLGYGIGKKVASLPVNQYFSRRSDMLIQRAIQNVHLSAQTSGHGDVGIFYGAFLDIVCDASLDADDSRQKHLRHVVGVAAFSKQRLTQDHLPQAAEVRPKGQFWPNVVRAIATIAMVQGYHVAPPPDQTDKNGAGQLPHEKELGEDV